MIMKKIISFLFLFQFVQLFAQTGGTTTYSLLNLGYSARANALGTDFISVKDQDINLGVSNPSLYNTKMNKSMGINQALLAGGINYGMFTYARDLKKIGTFAGHLRYIDYGKMERTDVNGAKLGNFTPSEYILGAGLGRQLNPELSIGANVNLIYSQLESYNSFGASLDLAGTYTNEKHNLLVTALVKNAGVQFKSYISKSRAPLPAEFQMAISHKLEHAPFRFSILAHHLNTWNIAYIDPNLKPTIDALTGDTIAVKYPGFGSKLFQHFTFQTEILLGKSLHVRGAFDYHKRQEMKLDNRPGAAGFSFGIGMYFKRISIDYGFAIFSKAGFNNMLTLTTDLSKWKK